MAEAPSPLPKFDGTPPMGYLWLWMGRWVGTHLDAGVPMRNCPCCSAHAGVAMQESPPLWASFSPVSFSGASV